MTIEADLENYFRQQVRRAGGRAYKITSMTKGIPDRLVLFPGGRVDLVELKTDTGRTSPAQRVWHARAEALGTTVPVLHGKAEIDAWLIGMERSGARNPPTNLKEHDHAENH